jgi:hypothetical protein
MSQEEMLALGCDMMTFHVPGRINLLRGMNVRIFLLRVISFLAIV